MKRFQLLTTALAIFISCSSLCAQKKSVPGYYITQQGDTIKGTFPKYTQWSKNPSQVEFIIEGSTKHILLTPQDAQKFLVDGYDEYTSYTGKRLVNPIEDEKLLNGKYFGSINDSTQQVMTFLRLVKRTTGGDLYILNDAIRMNFFFQLPKQQLTELRYKKSLVQSQIKEAEDYKQQLNNLFAEAIVQKNLTSTLKRLQYKEKELSSFFQSLFPATLLEHKKPETKAQWVISGGAVLNMVSVDSDKSSSARSRTYSSSLSPLLSVGIMVPVGRNFGKYFFYPQVKLFRYKNTGEQNQSTVNNIITYYQTDFAIIAQVSGGINVVNQESFRIFIAGGLGMLGQPGGKQVKEYYDVSNGRNLTTFETKLSTAAFAMDASAGVELNKRIFLSANYMIPTSIGNFISYNPKLSGIQIRVGYKL
jgi:hypothetical protein